VRRAREAGLIDVRVQDLREFTKDRHRTVDDRPFGGGEGMVMKPEPVLSGGGAAWARGGRCSTAAARPSGTAIVFAVRGREKIRAGNGAAVCRTGWIIFICGRYEGVDERVAEHLATEEISVGDFVLSGGELPAMLVVDAVTRLLPGALGTRLRRRMSRLVRAAFCRQERNILPPYN